MINDGCPGCGFPRGEGHGFECQMSESEQDEFDSKQWVLVDVDQIDALGAKLERIRKILRSMGWKPEAVKEVLDILENSDGD